MLKNYFFTKIIWNTSQNKQSLVKPLYTFNFVCFISRGRGWAYTGLHDTITERNFTWTDGTATNYFNWKTGEPNNQGNEDCVTVYDTGLWYDFGCSTLGYFICKFQL